MKFDGLTVDQIIQGGYASAGGLKEGDLITSIDGQATRYMPLKKAIEVIRESAGQPVKITFRRILIEDKIMAGQEKPKFKRTQYL